MNEIRWQIEAALKAACCEDWIKHIPEDQIIKKIKQIAFNLLGGKTRAYPNGYSADDLKPFESFYIYYPRMVSISFLAGKRTNDPLVYTDPSIEVSFLRSDVE